MTSARFEPVPFIQSVEVRPEDQLLDPLPEPVGAPAAAAAIGRVFGVGMNKTGTTSLKRAYTKLGLLPAVSSALSSRAGITDALFERRDFEPALRYARLYRSFEDRPWNMWDMYQRLDQRYPGSRFILTRRDPGRWWRSVERWITVSKTHMGERYRLHLEAPSLGRDAMIEGYLRHNQRILDYFAGRDDLLVLDIEAGQGWPELCGFLGLPQPDEPFPHANRQSYDTDDRDLESRRARRGRRARSLMGVEGPLSIHHCMRCSAQLPAREKPKPKAELPRIAFRALQDRAFLRPSSAARSAPGPSIDDMAVVCCFFNPCAYRSRPANYLRFRDSLRATPLPVLTVEMAIGDDPFALGEEAGEVLRLRCRDAMWQKERLLNLGIQEMISRGYRKIVWLDVDVVFEDAAGWPWTVAAELERVAVCQVFSGVRVEQEGGRTLLPGVSAVRHLRDTGRALYQDRLGPSARRPFGYPLGYSGYGWAARAEVLEEIELYDASVIGGGDKLIYAASLGIDDEWYSNASKQLRTTLPPCPRCNHVNVSSEFVEHYFKWARRWDEVVDGSLGYAPGLIRTLYHGDRRDRHYQARRDILLRHRFTPVKDLAEAENGTWCWASAKPDLHLEVQNYLFERREDL